MTDVNIPIDNMILFGNLDIPANAIGLVLFAHGSGSSRFSPRNQYVAEVLRKSKLATLLFDLLSEEEELVDNVTGELRFNIPLLAERLIGATEWVMKQKETQELPMGYFGSSTGAAAALIAAAKKPVIKAVVSRGGRPDLAIDHLPKVKAPTLLIVGGNDEQVIGMNKEALAKMKCTKELKIVEGATHLFEEPGKLEEISHLAAEWFVKWLKK